MDTPHADMGCCVLATEGVSSSNSPHPLSLNRALYCMLAREIVSICSYSIHLQNLYYIHIAVMLVRSRIIQCSLAPF